MQLQQHSRLSGIGQPNATRQVIFTTLLVIGRIWLRSIPRRYASPKLWPSSRPLHVPCSQAQPKQVRLQYATNTCKLFKFPTSVRSKVRHALTHTQAGEAPSTNSRRTQLLGLIAIANLRTLGEVPGMAEATAAPAPGAIGEVANMIATDFAKGWVTRCSIAWALVGVQACHFLPQALTKLKLHVYSNSFHCCTRYPSGNITWPGTWQSPFMMMTVCSRIRPRTSRVGIKLCLQK